MDLVSNLLLGFENALSLTNLIYCFIGVTVGTLIGVLPGIGPVATIAMLLPITYTLDPSAALIMLAGIYYGAQYGGSTTAILVNIPGDASAVITCLDGHKMATKGRAGAALGIAALGLVGAIVLANGSLIKAFCMTLLGLLVGLIGTDINSGALRFTFGLEDLQDGLNFVAISMGIFGYAEIMNNLEARQTRNFNTGSVGKVLPSWADIKNCFGPIVRGTAIGSILGVLPGGGALLSSFASYTVEKKIAGKNADPAFGEGNIRGVAGPETANNAGAQTSFIPMLTLGIPSNAVMALMIGAMMIHDIQPGPLVMSSDPGLFWGLIVSMWIGNLMLIILNLPMINIWVKLLKVPYRWLFPAIIAFCVIGTYSINNNVFDIWVSIVFGLLGYLFIKLGCEAAPFILGFILGPMMEENLRRALLLSRGDPSVFVTRPISCGLLIAAAILLILVLAPSIRKKREVAFQDDD